MLKNSTRDSFFLAAGLRTSAHDSILLSAPLKKPIFSIILNLFMTLEDKFTPRNMSIIYMTLSCITFTILGILAKLCLDIPPYQLTYHRSVVELFLSFITLIQLKGSLYTKDAATNQLLLIRGAIGGLGLTMYFHALRYLPISICTVLFMLTPLWIGIVTCVKDRQFDGWNFLFMMISFFGMIFIIKPGFFVKDNSMNLENMGKSENSVNNENSVNIKNGSDDDEFHYYLGAFLAIATSMLSGMVYFAIKNLKGKVQIATIVLYLNFFNAAFSGFGQVLEGAKTLTWDNYFMLLMIGLSGWASQMLRSRALILEKVFFMSVLMYSQIALAYLADAFILGIHNDFYSNIGCLLIGLSMIGLIFMEQRGK